MIYKIKAGDTLQKIAGKVGVPSDILLAFNENAAAITSLKVNQTIRIPNLEDIPDNAELVSGVTAGSIIARAKSAIDKKIRYCLGKGGMNPDSPLPFQKDLCKGVTANYCDCSGFVCWVLGLSRKTRIPFYQKHGGWIYTDSMEADVRDSAGIFNRLDAPEPGCIVVYGAGNRIGHVGIVSEVAGGQMKKVIHCSSSNDAKKGDAIQETLPTVFNRRDVLWGRYVDVVG